MARVLPECLVLEDRRVQMQWLLPILLGSGFGNLVGGPLVWARDDSPHADDSILTAGSHVLPILAELQCPDRPLVNTACPRVWAAVLHARSGARRRALIWGRRGVGAELLGQEHSVELALLLEL